jgi:hypothetical protein
MGDLNITPKEFIDTLFADIDPDTEVVCVSKGFKTEDGMGFLNLSDEDPVFKKWNPAKQKIPYYVCVSSCDGEKNAKGTAILRKTGNLVRAHFLMLDDIGSGEGSKASSPPVVPTAKVETSVDNYQWYYALKPTTEFKKFEALTEYCHEKNWGDTGAGGCYRICRIPGSANIKKGRNNFKSIVTHWEPNKVWDIDKLAIALGCTDLDERAKLAKGASRRKSQGVTSSEITNIGEAIDTIDPLYVWLKENGHIVKDDGGDWVDIKCPNHAEHTTGGDVGSYSPLGRGSDDYWVQTRAWKCLHGHCSDHKFKDFMKVMGKLGAPHVSGLDQLPWLQAKFTYIGVGKRVADLHQRKFGGHWLWEFEDWANMYKFRILLPGRDKPVEMKTALLEHKNTRKLVGTIYQPVRAEEDAAIIERHGQKWINNYVPPNWPETDRVPEIFLEHMDFILPNEDERELFLDWLAYKLQNPADRSYAIIMVAEDTFGIGRSWIKSMLYIVLQGKVQSATLSQLIGKGTSAEKNYNDWAACCQFIVVEEAKDNLAQNDFYQGYETFKQNVDTRVTPIRVNPKYERTRQDFMYFNALIFTNHADALALPEGDRRVCVLTNPTKVKSEAYYERLNDALNDDEAGAVYHFLMRRDVSGYSHVKPPMTPGKSIMIERNRPPSDEIEANILVHCTGDILTKKMLKSQVIRAANELDYDNIASSSGGIIRHLWGKMGALREEKNGARYTVNGVNTEVRAIRNVKTWKHKDDNREKKAFVAELLKNDKTGGAGIKLVK